MIRYLGPKDDIHKLTKDELKPGMIILNLYSRHPLEYDNALIVASHTHVVRVWQPERDDSFKLTGNRRLPPHPSMTDHPPSLYYMSRNDIFICDTAEEANKVISTSSRSRAKAAAKLAKLTDKKFPYRDPEDDPVSSYGYS